MTMSANDLKNQLELARIERALSVSESLADHRALLTTTELARINGVLTGKTDDPCSDCARPTSSSH